LLALALRHDIETQQVKRLIRHRKVAAPPDSAVDALWPRRLRVLTLGRFGIWIDDKPLPLAKSAGRKPLEVLKALIGLGSADVSLASLGERVWPELDGAAAHNACHVAIHRLRKMLADESAIRIDHGMVALNWSDTWADVEAFRALAHQIRAALAGRARYELEPLANQLLAAYSGHFLPGEERPWAVGVREQLRARFTHLTIELSAALEHAGAHDAALVLNQHGIELDPLAEAFHRGVIRGLIALGRKAEAMQAYRHCRVTLQAGLGVQPSAETRALHAGIGKL
jgi:DNA-binding SARP family transcriptional activator